MTDVELQAYSEAIADQVTKKLARARRQIRRNLRHYEHTEFWRSYKYLRSIGMSRHESLATCIREYGW